MLGSVVDLILLALIAVFAVNGYRQGFLVSALSFVGFFGGALVGLQVAPLIVEQMTSDVGRVLVSLGAVFGLALLGQLLAAWAGNRLRRAIASPHGRRIDDIGGIGVSVIALLIVSWMIAGPLADSSLPGVARAVRNSAIIQGVDAAMPDAAQAVYNGLRDTIATGDFPKVFPGMTPTDVSDVPAPDPKLAQSAVVQNARRSVVKVLGTAPSCSRRIEGSGFIYAQERIMTNAHVVAGTRGDIDIEVNGNRYEGRVVVYEPDKDLAVVRVPGLEGPVMRWAANEGATNEGAIVLGYPLNGPYRATPARIRDVRQVRGPDIYEDKQVTREVYTLNSQVRSGNSGGPLLDLDGRVLGVIFAAAVDDEDVGFALTAKEASDVAQAGSRRTEAVSTGNCV
jgi:S1-C subfamily serine protease